MASSEGVRQVVSEYAVRGCAIRWVRASWWGMRVMHAAWILGMGSM